MLRQRALHALLGLSVLLAACGGGQVQSPSPSAPPTSPAGSAAPTGQPSPTAMASAPPSLSPPASPAETPFGGTAYTVQRGDTLAAIGRAFETSIDQLVTWNAGRYPSLVDTPGVIEPGWILVVSLEPGVTPQPTPTPAPATPRATQPTGGGGCTAGNRVPAGSAQVFKTIPNAGPGVALTFDMGGRMDPAVEIMNFLIANGVCATIFPTGAMSQTPQGQQVLAIIKAHPELFEIGSHTMYHCDLVRGGGGSPSLQPCVGGPPSADRIRKELTDAEAILRAGTGQNPQPYWRPPYGSINDAVLAAAASAGYTKTFLWDIDTADWKPISDGGPTAEQIAARVIGGSVNGSNVLFHLGGYETLEALHLIVPALRDRGFTLTSLSDLLD